MLILSDKCVKDIAGGEPSGVVYYGSSDKTPSYSGNALRQNLTLTPANEISWQGGQGEFILVKSDVMDRVFG